MTYTNITLEVVVMDYTMLERFIGGYKNVLVQTDIDSVYIGSTN